MEHHFGALLAVRWRVWGVRHEKSGIFEKKHCEVFGPFIVPFYIINHWTAHPTKYVETRALPYSAMEQGWILSVLYIVHSKCSNPHFHQVQCYGSKAGAKARAVFQPCTVHWCVCSSKQRIAEKMEKLRWKLGPSSGSAVVGLKVFAKLLRLLG